MNGIFCVMMGRSLCVKQKKNLLFYEIYHRAPILNRDDITAYQCYTGQCLYYNIVSVVWSIKVFYGCMRVCPEDVKQKKETRQD